MCANLPVSRLLRKAPGVAIHLRFVALDAGLAQRDEGGLLVGGDARQGVRLQFGDDRLGGLIESLAAATKSRPEQVIPKNGLLCPPVLLGGGGLNVLQCDNEGLPGFCVVKKYENGTGRRREGEAPDDP
jgi:hypothetical protein